MARKYKRKGEEIPGSLEVDKLNAEALLMGDLEFTAPDDVKRDPVAMRKWREVTGIFREAGLSVVSSTDSGVIGRYCTMYSEYLQLRRIRDELETFELPLDDSQEILATLEHEYSRARARRLWDTLEFFNSLDGLIKLDRAINQKQKAVLDIEDRIFLNPAAKARKLNIKNRPARSDKLADMGFDV